MVFGGGCRNECVGTSQLVVVVVQRKAFSKSDGESNPSEYSDG